MQIFKRLGAGALAVALLAPLSLTQLTSKPNLSGKWNLNLEKSWEAGGAKLHYQSILLEIDHKEPAIRIVQTVDGSKVIPIEVRTDGVPVQSSILGGAATSWAKWEGNTLVSFLHRDTGNGNSLEIVRRLTISADGKTMTAIREPLGGKLIAEFWDRK